MQALFYECLEAVNIFEEKGLTEIAYVHDGVKPRLNKDQDAEKLVNVDVVIEWQEESKA